MTAPLGFLKAPGAARLWALLTGLAAGLAHPPFGFLPGLLGYAGLLALLNAAGPQPRRSAFFRGWLAGTGYFAISCWWIVEPFMVDARTQGWMAPFALVLLAAGLALFWGLAALIYRVAAGRGLSRVVVFAGSFALLEWVRGWIFTGFPWNLPGETWRAGSPLSQAAALVGAYGLTWITLAIAAAPVVLFDRGRTRPARAFAVACALAVLAGLYAYGLVRLGAAASPAPDAPRIRVVQADIDQKDKWRPENLAAIFQTYVGLTRREGPAADVVIWPEGALPAVIDDLLVPGSPFAPALRDALLPGQILIMGANRVEAGPDRSERYFNSLVAFRREGAGLRVADVYDKHRLVPFGEYMPLGRLAGQIGLRSLVHMPDDFTAGPPPRPMMLDGLPPLQPLICYEALFPGLARTDLKQAGPRPAWILNASNDAWFGMTSGPLQHLNIASYRAIEEGLPIVRATPTGVSAVIDAYGRVAPQGRLGLGAFGVIDQPLPRPLSPTPYARFGDRFFFLMLALSTAACFGRFRRPRLDDAGAVCSSRKQP